MNYPFISLQELESYIPLAAELGVSKVARGRGGFIEQYRKYGPRRLPDYWVNKRRNFIHRHMVQYEKNPTPRRHLALIMWAYKP